MSGILTCPICTSPFGASAHVQIDHGLNQLLVKCEICGKFRLSLTLYEDEFESSRVVAKIIRSALSYRIRNQQNKNDPPFVDREFYDNLKSSDKLLPSPIEQSINILRFIGSNFEKNGEIIEQFPIYLSALVGSIDLESAHKVACELKSENLIDASEVSEFGNPYNLNWISLTLSGWRQYETEKKGKFAGKYGFIALKFGEILLDNFLNEHIKPAVNDLGYELVDMRDTARDGVIDTLMRTQIRDSAFVLADLTHDSPGAYWEAGYAEGLGKPVLFICEKEKFKVQKSHFDTNHCTTIPWDSNNPEEFKADLVATLRRSLNLFGK